MTPTDKQKILAAAARHPRLDDRFLSTAMITTMAQTADRVDDLSNTFYHMMKVNPDIKDGHSSVPLLSFRTDISTSEVSPHKPLHITALHCCSPAM